MMCKQAVCLLQDWNQHGVARMCRMLTVLQPTLASLGGSTGPDASKPFDKARLYFSLLMYSPEGLQKAVSDRPGRFTAAEYAALLQVSWSAGCKCCAVAKCRTKRMFLRSMFLAFSY